MMSQTIIWDFDGTLYPLVPYDSEQTLMLLRLHQLNGRRNLVKRRMIRVLIHADMQQWFRGRALRKIYGLLYGWSLKGTKVSLLERAAEHIAAEISPADRDALHRLHAMGFRMHVISCGTLDLSQRTLSMAGIRGCFESVQANPLQIENGLISGLTPHLITARDKVRAAKQLVRGNPQNLIAVGDGYTDLPLLDWVQTPVMMDHDNSKRARYAATPYQFTPSITALYKVLTQNSDCCIRGIRMPRQNERN